MWQKAKVGMLTTSCFFLSLNRNSPSCLHVKRIPISLLHVINACPKHLPPSKVTYVPHPPYSGRRRQGCRHGLCAPSHVLISINLFFLYFYLSITPENSSIIVQWLGWQSALAPGSFSASEPSFFSSGTVYLLPLIHMQQRPSSPITGELHVGFSVSIPKFHKLASENLSLPSLDRGSMFHAPKAIQP